MKNSSVRLPALLAAAALAPSAVGQDFTQHRVYTLRADGELLDYFGHSVDGAGDWDQDGYDDVLVGAPQVYTEGSGYVQIVSGFDGRVLLRIDGAPSTDGLGDHFGFAVCNAGDVTGDGRDDVLVGAPKDDDGGEEAGSVALYSGADGSSILRIDGVPFDELGTTVAAVGDLDQDGYADFAASASRGGKVHVYSGEWVAQSAIGQTPLTPQVLYSYSGTGDYGFALAGVGDVDADTFDDFAIGTPNDMATGTVSVYSGASGALLHTFVGIERSALGQSIAGVGDLNGDTFDDFVVGACREVGSGPDAGRARVYSGEWVARTAAGQAPVTPEVLYTFLGDAPGDRFGAAAAGVGDVDGDGTMDVAVGASRTGPSSGTGYVRVFSGADGTTIATIGGLVTSDFTGWAVAGAGDVNKDGLADLVVGMARDGELSQGSALVYSGKRLGLASDAHSLSVTTGGAMNMSLDSGASVGGHLYVVVGTTSGIEPGLPTPLGVWPLNWDFYSTYSLISPPELVGFIGFLDPAGRAAAQVALPPSAPPNLIGFTLHYAAFSVDPNQSSLPTTSISNAVVLGFTIDQCSTSDPLLDCNGNGVVDACEIANGTASDCDGNTRPDECDLASGGNDLDVDSILDSCTTLVYVDGNAFGANDGTSWADAYTDLRLALAFAPPYSQLWVAEGTYKPWPDGTNRNGSFILRSDVGVYGGFTGVETSLDQRDWIAHPTILSGDLDGNDGPNLVGYQENSYSVLTAPLGTSPTAVLDGFVVHHGSASETAGCDAFDVFFANCRGGAIYALGSPTVRNCDFVENYGGFHGGAVYNYGNATYTRCSFSRNTAFEGGAVYNDAGARPMFVNCSFVENVADRGGAIYSTGAPTGEITMAGCVFNGNLATSRGGAMYSVNVQNKIASCTFANNEALVDNGGLVTTVGSVTFIDNSILWANVDPVGTTEQAQLAGGTYVVAFSAVEGWSGALLGISTSAADPLFVDLDGADGVAGNADDDLHLSAVSPLIDAGDTTRVPADATDLDRDGDTAEPLPLDVDGGARVAGSVVDPGAFEG